MNFNVSPVTAVVTELVSAGLCGEALVAAVARLEAAGVFAPVVTARETIERRAGRPGNPESAGARRTRAWRSRREVVTGVVTPVMAAALTESARNAGVWSGAPASAASQPAEVVTPVTVVTKKENPPHPLKKNSSPKPPRRLRRHKPSICGTPVTDSARMRVKVPGDTALHFELIALHPDRTIPDTGAGGWWWDPGDVRAAQASLDGRVVSLPRREVVVDGRALEARR